MSVQQTISSGGLGGKGHALLVVAGLGLAGLGLAAGLMLHAPGSTPAEVAVAEQASTAANEVPVRRQSLSAANPAADSSEKANNKRTAVSRAAEPAPLQTQRAALCGHCGVVEAVRPVQRKGEASGVGAVAGGVVGAVVGSQMGGGSGKTAMTVLGALGGGVAGNEVEKRTKSTTVYEVRVRMEDGTLRSFTSASSPSPGAAVTVDSRGFHVVQGGSSSQRVVRTMS